MKQLGAFLVVLALFFTSQGLYAQESALADNPRRQFVTISIDRMNTYPLHLKEYPLEQLVGTELGRNYDTGDYRSRDESIIVTVVRFRQLNTGAGITVYPFGAKNGATLAVRGSYETLPNISVTISSPAGKENYALSNARAYDLSIGVIFHDRSAGWGLGAHSFILVGKGKIIEPRGNGKRYFLETGGGVSTGPFGFEIFWKIADNRLTVPKKHKFYTVPIGFRATVSF